MANEKKKVEKTAVQIQKEVCEGYADQYNEALANKDMTKKIEAEAGLKTALKAYRTKVFDSVLYKLSQTENPMVEAVKQLSYTILKSHSVREEGVETKIELVETREQINLVRVAEYCKLSTLWQYSVEKLGLLLAIRDAKDVGRPVAELTKMTKDYRMTDLARKCELGETPASNTQTVKLIQSIIDELFPDMGLKVTKHDAAYLDKCFSNEDKRSDNGLKLGDVKTAHRLFAKMAHRILTNGSYEVSYKTEKEKKADAPKTDAQPADAKTEQVEAPAA